MCFFYPYSSPRQIVSSEQRHKGRREPIPEPGKWVGQYSQANRRLLYKVLCGNRGELALSALTINNFNYIEIYDYKSYCTCWLYEIL